MRVLYYSDSVIPSSLITSFFRYASALNPSSSCTVDAMVIDETVPTNTPINSVKEKENSASPPNNSNALTVNKVVPEVIKVRLKVALIALFEH